MRQGMTGTTACKLPSVTRRTGGLTSTRMIRMPSGSSICISISPHGSAAGSRTTGTPAEEEHHSRIVRRPRLPVDGQAQDIAVEAAAAVQVAGAQEDPAAQNVHTIPASRSVTQEVKENARSPAAMSRSLVPRMAA
jgi:hypothetical protein